MDPSFTDVLIISHVFFIILKSTIYYTERKGRPSQPLLSSYHHLVWLALIGNSSDLHCLHFLLLLQAS